VGSEEEDWNHKEQVINSLTCESQIFQGTSEKNQ